MPTYLTPGVYIEEVPSGSMPLSAAATAVGAFVGYTAKAPIDDLENDPEGLKPRMVTSWAQYKALYGGFTNSALMPQAVFGFFNNGGSRCYIVRVPHREQGTQALNQGDDGTVTTEDGTELVEFVGLADAGEITIRFGEAPEDEGAADEDASNAANAAVEDERVAGAISGVKDQAAATARAQAAALAAVTKAGDAAMKAAGANVEAGEAARTEAMASDETKEAAAKAAARAAAEEEQTFDVTIQHGGKDVEVYPGVSLAAGSTNVATVINEASSLVQVLSDVDDGTLAPAAGTTLTISPPERLPVRTSDFDGDAAARTGVRGLTIADDVTMVMVPDLWTATKDPDDPTKYDEKTWKAVQQAVKTHCELEANRMAIFDPPPNLDPQEVRAWRDQADLDTMFGTLYYPWLEVNNPAGSKAAGNESVFVPPCGHMAGVWTRVDNSRGVWKAPANEPVRGVIKVQNPITKGEQEILNPVGINAIRNFGTAGLKVWGARTLSVTDPSWRYINVRRLFNNIETSIMDGTSWVVFEPNDETLWQRVSRTVTAFLLGFWRDGALFGASADEAFFVKCDRENNPPESRDEGKLIVEVGIAPVKPAEFVIFRFSQKMLSSTG